MREIRVAIIGGAGFMGYAHSLGWALAPIAADAPSGDDAGYDHRAI